MSEKLIVCLDFDGTIHQYNTLWTCPEDIPDDVVPGFFEWANEASKYFRLVVYSARSRTESGITAMRLWFVEQINLWERHTGQKAEFVVEFAHEKPKAFLTIDDRAITFNGRWDQLPPKMLLDFVPWNKRERVTDPSKSF